MGCEGGATLRLGYPPTSRPQLRAAGHWRGRAGGRRAGRARALELAGCLPATRSVAKIRSPNFPILNRARVGH